MFFRCILNLQVGRDSTISQCDMDTVVMKKYSRYDMRHIIDCWNLDDSSRREKRSWSETCMSDVARISLILKLAGLFVIVSKCGQRTGTILTNRIHGNFSSRSTIRIWEILCFVCLRLPP